VSYPLSREQKGNEMTYQVIDIRTKQVVGTYASRKAASRRADTLDRAYGAVRYVVKFVD